MLLVVKDILLNFLTSCYSDLESLAEGTICHHVNPSCNSDILSLLWVRTYYLSKQKKEVAPNEKRKGNYHSAYALGSEFASVYIRRSWSNTANCWGNTQNLGFAPDWRCCSSFSISQWRITSKRRIAPHSPGNASNGRIDAGFDTLENNGMTISWDAHPQLQTRLEIITSGSFKARQNLVGIPSKRHISDWER